MSLDQGIKHGKEKRKQYYGAKAIDKSCRNHGSDDWAKANRMYRASREDERTEQELKEYNKGVLNMGQSLNELKEKLQRLEAQQFYHEMKDGWDSADFSYAEKLAKEIAELKVSIEGLEAINDGND